MLVYTGNSYLAIFRLIQNKTRYQDEVYYTYAEENLIAFNPFFIHDGVFDIEKKLSIKTLIMMIWKRENELPTRDEEVALSNAVNHYLYFVKEKTKLFFNIFYGFLNIKYRKNA